MTIRQVRLMNEVTQKEVAKALGVHVQTYRKLEQNPEKATIEQAKIISGILKIPYDDIVFFGSVST